MKMVSFTNFSEGSIMERAYLVLGRLRTTDGKNNGFYVTLRSPFKKYGEYMSLASFEMIYGLTQSVYGFRIRKDIRGNWRMSKFSCVVKAE